MNTEQKLKTMNQNKFIKALTGMGHEESREASKMIVLKPKSRRHKSDIGSTNKSFSQKQIISHLRSLNPKERYEASKKTILKPKSKSGKSKVIASNQAEKTERDREKIRRERAKKVVAYLTKNLPKSDFNPNWQKPQLERAIGKASFNSAIENNIYFSNSKEGNLLAIYDGGSVIIKDIDLEGVAKTIFEWSKVAHKLNDKNGTPPNGSTLLEMLKEQARKYKWEMEKMKSAKDILYTFTKKAIEEGELFKPSTSARQSKIEFANFLLGIVDELEIPLYRSRTKKLLLNCSDTYFGLKDVNKESLPYFDKMLNEIGVGGVNLGKNAAEDIRGLMINLLPLKN
ncbi:hypothetical protein B0O79_1018 [Flavobacteriaceae bacterium MAR_2009_75]|nr:hypothetical protein B0O79_1018 [Flavobacteriaceae bacterium MAR_2009_75]